MVDQEDMGARQKPLIVEETDLLRHLLTKHLPVEDEDIPPELREQEIADLLLVDSSQTDPGHLSSESEPRPTPPESR